MKSRRLWEKVRETCKSFEVGSISDIVGGADVGLMSPESRV